MSLFRVPDVLLIEGIIYTTVENVEELYRNSARRIGYRFDFFGEDETFIEMKEFRDVPHCLRIIEEMIHLCLPAPDDTVSFPHEDENDGKRGLWKYCLYDLLKRNK